MTAAVRTWGNLQKIVGKKVEDTHRLNADALKPCGAGKQRVMHEVRSAYPITSSDLTTRDVAAGRRRGSIVR